MTIRPTLPLPSLERARGTAGLTVRRREGRNAIADLSQAGCARLLFPRVAPGDPLEAVIANTSGGLTGGDRLALSLTVEEGAQALATTQACEKIYRSDGATATVDTRLAIGASASLSWLPQETILFDRARLARTLCVEMHASATLLAVEAVLLGRRASGETLRDGSFRDTWRIRREGRLVFAEETRLGGDIAAAGAGPATLAGGAALATVVLIAPDAAERLEDARNLLTNQALDAAISSFDGLCVARLVAQDGAALRGSLIPLLQIMGGAVPRVWSL